MELLAHIEAFVAVADERNFTRAAERLGIPQPLLSRRIKNLEAHWGQPLLDRASRASVPTPFAESVMPHARELLARAERLDLVVAAARRGIVHTLGVPPDWAAATLAKVLRAATEHELVLAIRELPAQSRAQALDRGELSVALVRDVPDDAALRVRMGLAFGHGSPRPTGEWHLDALRPRRDSGEPANPAILISPEDEIPEYIERLRRVATRAGLPQGCVRVNALNTAAAEVLTSAAGLLCDEATARRLRLRWAPLAERSLDRGYDLRSANASGRAIADSDWMLPLLAQALTADGDPGRPVSGVRDPDGHVRLAASG